MSSKGSNAVGIIVAVLIIGAVATIGFYQVEVAPGQVNTTTTTTSSTGPSVNCHTSPSSCANVTIVSGASSPYSGYSTGSTTLYGYDPLTVTLVIGVNNTILFTNQDAAFHTATAASADPSSFDTKCLDGVGAPCPSGQGNGVNSAQVTLTVAGTYTYHCIYHPWMQGKIIVKQGTGTTTSTTSTSNSSTSALNSVQATIVSGASTPYSGYPGTPQLYGYNPQTITVVIGVNNTVTWTNNDSAFHTVTAASSDPATFDSGCLNGVGAPCPGSSIGSSFTYTFTVPGTYVYHCNYHPWMMGKVVVLTSSGTTTSTSG